MSIFDNLKNKAASGIAGAVSNIGKETGPKTITFAALPESVEQMKALPQGQLKSVYDTAALTVCALCAYAAAPEVGIEMLNFLKGPQPLSPHEKQFLRDRIVGKEYIPFSFFQGATPDNDYTPSQPYTITIETNPYTYQNEGYATMHIRSGGADSIRQVQLRQQGSTGQWFLWEQFLLSDIRQPKSQNPWA